MSIYNGKKMVNKVIKKNGVNLKLPKDLKTEFLTFGITEISPGESTTEHSHSAGEEFVFILDGEGYLIPIPESQLIWDLPYISGIKQGLGRIGHQTNAADAYLALEIVRYIEDENPLLASMVSEINLSNSKTIELHLIKGGTKIRITRETYYRELFVLKNYIANYLDWGQLAKIDYIDLRFENQLIVKTKT